MTLISRYATGIVCNCTDVGLFGCESAVNSLIRLRTHWCYTSSPYVCGGLDVAVSTVLSNSKAFLTTVALVEGNWFVGEIDIIFT